MILSFRHKGLQKYFESGSKAGIQAHHAARLRLVLARLHAAHEPKDMDLPGLRLHELKGRLEGLNSVMISGNWRVIFRFEGQDAVDVDYLDYH
ncbi:type II toxin-antitoxin system RelE/ParE family toxin [Geomonas sp. Red32]|uniref:type II toxin-antitoxin system RelE/ParE family toxin n=1 Tax=Geomonas sp. Red32 TaxID=2912856 RepID=UPI00202CA901|nr:type II toxin-antitoxin system RelE/ParE family toxin [Geomonas sp. Red32]MCM0083625.1 type II toxin-antitoxin system RelE/ParE family toxin [Geomonas sp. Red32]